MKTRFHQGVSLLILAIHDAAAESTEMDSKRTANQGVARHKPTDKRLFAASADIKIKIP
ncbi:MAG: hypothetical protein HY885_14275 [Deltaproteobacteria bacterium]|nr:hypothetical protein [Deltaproteobacteria bacterium]